MSADLDPQVRTLYRTLLIFATAAAVILALGLVEFVHFEPPGQITGAKARIVGIFQYDPITHTTLGPDRSSFARTEEFAAVVDWSSLSGSIKVDARWYDIFGELVGRVGPGSPAQLASQTIVPVVAPPGFHNNLPGRYTFVVERFSGDIPVEVLARRIVLVERS